METSLNEKDKYEDLASLFLPDVLHQVDANSIQIKPEVLDDTENNNKQYPENGKNSYMEPNYQMVSANTYNSGMGAASPQGVPNFLGLGNPFNQTNGHFLNPFVPVEPVSIQNYSPAHVGATLAPSFQHYVPGVPWNHLPRGAPGHMNNTEVNYSNSPQVNINAFPDNLNYHGASRANQGAKHPGFDTLNYDYRNIPLHDFDHPSPHSGSLEGETHSSQKRIYNNNTLEKKDFVMVDNENFTENKNEKYKKEKSKQKKNYKKSAQTQVGLNYSPGVLLGLLDLVQDGSSSSFKIIDKDNNEVKLKFGCFLNGRFLTNDADNQNFMQSKADTDAKNGSVKDWNTMDPKVISCYRRNYILVSLNLNLSGFSTSSPERPQVLKLQTKENGYLLSRVIKYFETEVSAHTNVSTSRNVPLIIYDDSKSKEKSKDELEIRDTDDSVSPESYNLTRNTIALSDSAFKNNEIDNYYTIKKLQFKNATPNNGNSAFQNYYYLKIKVSAVVADLYFNDYIDESGSYGNSTSSEVLFEYVSLPIIVRGRNPSFYSDRKDILVKGRVINSKESYKCAARDSEKANASKDIPSSGKVGSQENKQPTTRDYRRESEKTKDYSSESEDVQIDGDPDKIDFDEGSQEETSDDNDEARIRLEAVQKLNKRDRIPPLLYTATTASLDLKNALEDIKSNSKLDSLDKKRGQYKYFPISSVYYLPPVNVVYFPHGVHHQNSNLGDNQTRESGQLQHRNSNVYFK